MGMNHKLAHLEKSSFKYTKPKMYVEEKKLSVDD